MTTTTREEHTGNVEADAAHPIPVGIDDGPDTEPGTTPSADLPVEGIGRPRRSRRRRAPRRRAMTAGAAWVVMVIALTVGLLLNAEAIEHTAETQPVGIRRNVAVALASPVAGLSRTLGLHLPRAWIAGAVERGDTGGDSSGDIRTGQAVPDSEGGPDDGPETGDGTQAPPVDWAGSNVVWIGGDSLMVDPGPLLARSLDDVDGVEWATFSKPATGLVRPDAFDWLEKMNQEMAAYNPRVVVMSLGANDGQGIPAGTLEDPDDGDLGFGTEGWKLEYARRTGEMMDLAGSGGRPVVWLGHPVTSSGDHNERIEVVNDVYRAQAGSRDNVTYVDTWELFSDEDGEYADYLPGTDGRPQLMRATDGIHYSAAGAERLTEELLPLVLERFGESPAVDQEAPADGTD